MGFPFWTIFLRFRDIYVLYYGNQETDKAIGGSIRRHNTQSRTFLEILTQLFFKLGNRNLHHKRIKMTPVVPLP